MKLLMLNQLESEYLERIPACYEIVMKQKKDVCVSDVSDVDVIVGNIDPALLSEAKQCRFLQLESAGNDRYLQIPAQIALCNASGSFGIAIAEYVIGSLIAWKRSLFQYYDAQKQGFWQRRLGASGLAGNKALILGCGDVGGSIAAALKALGVHVSGYRRQAGMTDHRFDEIIAGDALHDTLKQVDILINALPHTAATKGFLTKDKLCAMKPEAMFVNIGRGSVVHLDDLYEVLNERKIAGAILDVYEIEPLPEAHPLWKLDNVLMTPHISGTFETRQAWLAYNEIVIENLRAFALGKSLRNLVDREHEY